VLDGAKLQGREKKPMETLLRLQIGINRFSINLQEVLTFRCIEAQCCFLGRRYGWITFKIGDSLLLEQEECFTRQVQSSDGVARNS
jgi:hypothetical protein